MVPASTLMYGSSFWIETLIPRARSNRPSEAAVIPFPSELTTPPVKKIYFAISECCYSGYPRKEPSANSPAMAIRAGHVPEDNVRGHRSRVLRSNGARLQISPTERWLRPLTAFAQGHRALE